jgi:hypothetical protein
LKLTDVSDVRTASIIRAMMAHCPDDEVRTSETSVNFNVITWRYIPEDPKLHTRRRENLKSLKDYFVFGAFFHRPILETQVQ